MLEDKIREILANHGKLPTRVDSLAKQDSLYDAGLTSHASVSVMIALEDMFDVEFPDELLERATFGSIEAIANALVELGVSS